jgi:hypothetical protein
MPAADLESLTPIKQHDYPRGMAQFLQAAAMESGFRFTDVASRARPDAVDGGQIVGGFAMYRWIWVHSGCPERRRKHDERRISSWFSRLRTLVRALGVSI